MRSDDHDLRSFPRPVRVKVSEVVSRHGLRWRIQHRSGGHVYLYPGDGTRPFKISASREAEQSLAYLDAWCATKGYLS
jgi:hypothetical protein